MWGRTDTRFPHPISGDGAAPAKRPVCYWHLMDMAPSPLSGVKRTCLLALQMSAFDPKRTCPLPSAAGSGGYDGGKYEKQRQPGEHDNLLNAAGIEFA